MWSATDKYKTNTLVLKMKAPLTKETLHIVHYCHMCYKAIQVNILQHPSFDLILDDLYGAGFYVDVAKKGEYQII